jgi:serine phosphatase RsbU (regulator of sigma subunit)
MTLALAQIDVRAGRMVYANAGHPSAHVLDRSGALKATLESTGMPLGLLSDTRLPCNEERLLEPGDTVVFLTDGILECRGSDGEYFEVTGVLDTIRTHIDEPAQQIVHRVHEAAGRFSKGRNREDDMTIVVCKLAADG